jgi:hypothetical protein
MDRFYPLIRFLIKIFVEKYISDIDNEEIEKAKLIRPNLSSE